MNIFVEHVPSKGSIAPQNVAAAGNATSGWTKADEAPDYLAQLNLGVLGGGTVTPAFEQATDAAGAGAKALVTGGDVSAVSANNTLRTIQFSADKLDSKNGFLWFRLKLSNVGGTGALVAASIHAIGPRNR